MSPAPRALAGLGVWCALGAAAAFGLPLLTVWAAAGAALALALGVDAARLRALGPFEVDRQVAGSLAAGVWSGVELRVRNPGRRAAALRVYDHHPPSMQARHLPRDLRLDAGREARLEYQIYPRRRGKLQFQPAELRVGSPLGLWRRRLRAGAGETVRVFPNFRAVVKYSLLARENRTSQLGIRRRPRRGEGSEFHQLREYRPGDALRQIDWKVTARLRRSISREYQDERDQQVVFLLDCGRKLHSRDDELSHFDHALDAVLLLAHAGLRQGDAVGLLTFSGERRWLAPRKGAAHLRAIMNAVYDLQTTPRASDYVRAAQDLLARVGKRALVVLVSNLRDEDHEELLLAARMLGRAHLVFVASMKERALGAALREPVRDHDGALRAAATHLYLGQRRHAHEALRRSGVLCLDVEPQQLPVEMVNAYLDIKSRGLL